MESRLTMLVLAGVFGAGGCGSGQDCTPHESTYCQEGKVYWVDGCGEFEEVIETCECGCKDDHGGCKTCECVPQCSGACCGPDGCGGECPDRCAATGQTCNSTTCRCEGECQSQTCADLGKDCGSWDDGCGKTIDCGDCPAGLDCLPDGTCEEGCSGGRTLCGEVCVDTSNDPAHCGGCNHPCGQDQMCQDGQCQDPTTCPENPCPDGYYCDINAGACRYGCLDDEGCGPGQYCDLQERRCRDKPEMCNGVDDDLDGRTDEDFADKGDPCDGPDADLCESGIWVCTEDGTGLRCQGDENRPERCDGLDNDCDGQTDEDYPNLGDACDGPDPDSCANGTITCTGDGLGTECVGDAPHEEVCNGIDDDCDGETDAYLRSYPVTLPDTVAIQAMEVTENGTVTLVSEPVAGGTQIWTGSTQGSFTAGDTHTQSFNRVAVSNGVVVAAAEGLAWWGTPGSMQEYTLPDAWTMDTVDYVKGSVVGLAGGVPYVTQVAEGEQDYDTRIERVGYTWTGSGFAGESIYVHWYMGGNVDRGGLVELPGGGAVALVFDEWCNNYWEGEDIRCRWLVHDGAGWVSTEQHYMCVPVGRLARGTSQVYGLTEPWFSNEGESYIRSTSTGTTVSDDPVPFGDGEDYPSLAANRAGRVALVTRVTDPADSTPLRLRFVDGAPAGARDLRVTLGENDYYSWTTWGDEVVMLAYERIDWSSPLTNLRLVRELVCP
jgi:hypothetical protein